MNCIEAQKRMNLYLEKRLQREEEIEFLDHVQSCKECREELDLYLIIHQVLNENETDANGETYVYRKSLEKRMNESRKDIRKKKFKGFGMAVLTVVLLLVVLVLQYDDVLRDLHKERIKAIAERKAGADLEAISEEIETELESSETESEEMDTEAEHGTGETDLN